MTKRYYLAGGESLQQIRMWDMKRRAALDWGNALAESHGCVALQDDCGFAFMRAPDDRCPPGWRRKRTTYLNREGRRVTEVVLVPARKTKEGRQIADDIEGSRAPHARDLMQIFTWGRGMTLQETFASPGLEHLPTGEWIIVANAAWPPPKDSTLLKTSDYYRMRGD